MKVTIKGTTEELLDLAQLLVWGRGYRDFKEASKNTNTARQDVRARDDVPNRFREEGAQ